MNLLDEFTVYAPLTTGSQFTVTLTEVVSRANPKYDPADPKSSKGFIDFMWKRISDGRIIRDSRIFPTGVNILIDQIQSQDNSLPTSVSLSAFVQNLITSEHTFDAWCVDTERDGIHYRNIQFIQPAPAQPASTPADSNLMNFN